ncbi:MAG: alpha/beta fold hydrolase [Acidimicrobiia bacterium]|nr:alpha/beta fold hydrolase [Acidimicrobiia bacterium]
MTTGTNCRRWHRGWAGAMAVSLLAAGCSSDNGGDGAGPTTTTADRTTSEAPPATGSGEEEPAQEDATFVEGECWWALPEDLPAAITVTCGTIEVPADRNDPESETITLAVDRIHHADADADDPPIVNLHGGPGGDSLSEAPASVLTLSALEERDLIMYDQRGSGRSTPSLNCPEKEEAVLDSLGAADGWDEEFAANEEAVRVCRDRLVDSGVDLDDYDTLASVADLETIRRAFDIETWNLWGASYGTRLGLAYAREHPDRVRSLVIDSVYGPHIGGAERTRTLPDGAVERLSAACDAEPDCEAANGDVEQQLAKAQESFDDQPETITGKIIVAGEEVTRSFTLTGSDVKAGIFAALYETELIPQLPSIIANLAEGDRAIVAAFLSTGVPRLLDLSEGAYYSFECADSGRLARGDGWDEAQSDPGDAALFALATAEPFCEAWDVEELPASFNEPVDVDVPTLVYGGTLDPITPYDESKAQAERMPDARFVSVPGAGHGAAATDDCTRSARDDFWHDPAVDLPSCIDDLQIAPFAAAD